MGKPSSSCHNCGARLVQGAEICDLCGTLVSADDVSAPDWIDSERTSEPAFRTIPDPPAPKKKPPRPQPATPVKEVSRDEQKSDGDQKKVKNKTSKSKKPKAPVEAIPPPPASDERPYEEPVSEAPVDVLPEEDFFQADPTATPAAEPTEDAVTEVEQQKLDGEFENAEVLPEEDFFQSDVSVADSAKDDQAGDGPTEVELAKEAGTFESADVVPEEDFFGGGAEADAESSREADIEPQSAADEDAPTEVDLQKSAGTFVGADLEPGESFFDEPVVTPDAIADETLASAAEAAEDLVSEKQQDASDPADVLADDATLSTDTATDDTEFEIDHHAEHADREGISTEPVPEQQPSAPKKVPGAKSERNASERKRRVKTKSSSKSRRRHGSGREDQASRSRRGDQRKATPRHQERPVVAPQENFFEKSTSGDSGRRNALLVSAGGILLVAGLFLINSLSGGSETPTEIPQRQMTDVTPIAPPPLSDEQEEVAKALKAEIVPLTGRRRVAKQRELISVYALERRFDLAAVVQQEIAQAENSEVEWVRTGNYFYDWMETQSGATKTEYAKHAIAAYQRALDINPDNLDVRTNMALAYLYDPDNPMQAIRNTNIVLEKNPQHVLANFNKGVMLMQINRLNQAKDQFTRVKELVGDPNSPIYQRAEMAVQTIDRHSSG